jgi:hypothetical protein
LWQGGWFLCLSRAAESFARDYVWTEAARVAHDAPLAQSWRGLDGGSDSRSESPRGDERLDDEERLAFARPFPRFRGHRRDGRGSEVELRRAVIRFTPTTTNENPASDRVEQRIALGRDDFLIRGRAHFPLRDGGVLDRHLALREVVTSALTS